MSKERESCFRGIQKTSVIDYPGKVACVFFTGGCNFRCPYCYNTTLVERTAPELVWKGVWHFINLRRNVLQGIVISGGEPTLAPFLPDFLARVKDLDLAVKLDTNGSNPDVLADLLSKGLVDYVAMDIKNSPGRYAETCGQTIMDLTKIAASIRLLKDSRIPHEFRTTLSQELHSLAEIREIASFCGGGERFILQRVHPSSPTLSGKAFTPPSPDVMEKMAAELRPYFQQVRIR